MTNLNSQAAHLEQMVTAMPAMAPSSIVVCDDTWYHPDEGIFVGKCMAAIPYLMCNGYRIINHEGYRQNSGVIMGRGI